MAKFNINSFLKLSPEKQAQEIEKQTKELIKRLPTLKKQLKMYGDVSDEMYNLTQEEVSLMGSTYADAVRGGEITTPSSKRAYNSLIKNLRRYTKTSMAQLAMETAEQRMDSWLSHIRQNGSVEEIAYAEQLVASMTPAQKLGFTRSQYFLDVENWSSKGFVVETEQGMMSMMTLKLELYLQTWGTQTSNLYNTSVATDGEDKLRGAYRGRKPKIRS